MAAKEKANGSFFSNEWRREQGENSPEGSSRFEPINLVAAHVRRRSAPRRTNVRLVTSAAAKPRFMEREPRLPSTHRDDEPAG
jgi:hypothetical protein